MDQEVFRKVQPLEYLKRFLANDVRPDGRAPASPRNLKITTGSINTAVGSAMVKLGHTTTVAGLDATLVEPSANAPDHGTLEISVELLTIAFSTSRSSRSEDALVLSEHLRNLIGPHIDLSKLCVESGKLVWALRLSAYCIDNDGNLDDAMLIAAVAALQNVMLPEVRMMENLDDQDREPAKMVEGNDDPLYGEHDSVLALVKSERTIPLEMDSYPLTVSFCLVGGQILIDPSAEEETVSDSRITFVMRPTGELRGVLKSGGKHITRSAYNSCLAQAEKRTPQLVSQLGEAAIVKGPVP